MVLILASVAIVSAGISSLVSYWTARQAIESQAFEKLVAVRELKGNQVEDYFHQIVDQALTLAESRMVVDAMHEFRAGFGTITDEVPLTPQEKEAVERDLRVHYQNEFIGRFESALGLSTALGDYWPAAPGAQLLQQLYIADSPLETGSKHLLDAADDGSRYSGAHSRYHPLFRNFLERFGYYDIFLVDHETGDIVYSVYKEVDFGTSLHHGPYRDSNLAAAVRAARESGTPGFLKLVDYESYVPSYGAQASFIAAPIHDGEEVVGVLAFQMPVDRINEIMTSRQEWGRVGLGETGETYIVGDDFTLRNQSRFLIEDREAYLEILRASGSASAAQKISALGSSIGLQKVETEGTSAAAGGKTGRGVFPDYRNVPVLSAYRPLDLPDVHWVIMSEIDHAEALGPVRSLRNRAMFVQAILIVAIIAIAFWFSASLTRPLKKLTAVAGELAAGHLDHPVQSSGHDEIAVLSNKFESMRQSLQALVKKQEREIEALSVPLIPLRDDVVAMPLVGELDPKRLEKIREKLVEGLHASGAKAALIDLTGVPVLDSGSAIALVAMAKAANLLGVQVVLTGMQPQVAGGLADMDLQLDGIETERSLEAGVHTALLTRGEEMRTLQFTEEEQDA
jgi:anti-anti-sigma factor